MHSHAVYVFQGLLIEKDANSSKILGMTPSPAKSSRGRGGLLTVTYAGTTLSDTYTRVFKPKD